MLIFDETIIKKRQNEKNRDGLRNDVDCNILDFGVEEIVFIDGMFLNKNNEDAEYILIERFYTFANILQIVPYYLDKGQSNKALEEYNKCRKLIIFFFYFINEMLDSFSSEVFLNNYLKKREKISGVDQSYLDDIKVYGYGVIEMLMKKRSLVKMRLNDFMVSFRKVDYDDKTSLKNFGVRIKKNCNIS